MVWSQLVSLDFFIDITFRSHYVPGVDSASNRNEYQEYFLRGKGCRCVRLTNLPPPCAIVTKSRNLNFLEHSGPLQACNGAALPFSFFLRINMLLHHSTEYSRTEKKPGNVNCASSPHDSYTCLQWLLVKCNLWVLQESTENSDICNTRLWSCVCRLISHKSIKYRKWKHDVSVTMILSVIG